MSTLTYQGAHYRVRAARGKASDYTCACGSDRQMQWAYTGAYPAPYGGRGGAWADGPYSGDPADYTAMCARCHRDADRQRFSRPCAGTTRLGQPCAQRIWYSDAGLCRRHARIDLGLAVA